MCGQENAITTGVSAMRHKLETEPTDQELRAFVDAMLWNVDRGIREPDVLDEAIRYRRDMWVMLYRAGVEADGVDPQS